MPKKNSRIVEAILETAGDLHRLGMMDDAEYRKITIRHLGTDAFATARPISSKEIRKMREKANLSQAAFARSLNLSVGTSRSWSGEPRSRKGRLWRCSM